MTIRTTSVKLLVGLDKAKAPIWNEGIQEPLTGQTTLYDITKVCPCCAQNCISEDIVFQEKLFFLNIA